MKQSMERLYNGIIKENPTFVLMLGMCPTLAVTTSAINGLGMGLSTMAVLALSNLMISAMRKIIPDKVRIPAYIVIIATFVTVVELLLHAYVPALHESLGIYISLIVVNCIILGRAESYASKNPMLPSLFDGIGMGLGFTFALTLIGLVREFLGAGTIFGFSMFSASELLTGLINQWLDPANPSEKVQFWNRLLTDEVGSFGPMSIVIMAPGAFFILAILTAIQNVIKEKGEKAGRDVSKIQSGCNSDCMSCKENCGDKSTETREVKDAAKAEASVTTEEVKGEENVTVKNAEAVKDTEEVTAETTEDVKDAEEVTVETTEDVKDAEEVTVETTEDVKDIEEETSKTVEDLKKEADGEVKQKPAKRKKTLLEATQEIDIVELEELLEKNETKEDKTNE